MELNIVDIPTDQIEPSPYQHRRTFSQSKLKELANSIKRDGLIEPIVIRPKGNGYELIAGERRLRAVRLIGLPTILARVVDVPDMQARRMCAAENLQREDLSAIEATEAIVEMIDAELIENQEYQSFGKTPIDRVKWLLGIMASVEDSNKAGYAKSAIGEKRNDIYNKFVIDIETIFTNLPNPVKWRAFYNHDLPLVTSIDDDVAQFAAENKLNKSQTKQTQKLKEAAPDLFDEIKNTNGDETATVRVLNEDYEFEDVDFSDLSSREIGRMANRARMDIAGSWSPEGAITPKLPEGKFRCIVIDPPWPMKKIEREIRPNQGVNLDYPTMEIEQIRELPISKLADDLCHLYLWVTQKYLPVGLEIVKEWGFDYQCLLTWKKNVGPTPFSWMYDTEHVIYAHRGGLKLNRLGLRLSFDAPVTTHSTKPDVFFNERVIPASPKPRLEMFARKQRKGFEVWGNELQG